MPGLEDDDRCAACGTEGGFRFKCQECGFHFCKTHADPSQHKCPEVEEYADRELRSNEVQRSGSGDATGAPGGDAGTGAPSGDDASRAPGGDDATPVAGVLALLRAVLGPFASVAAGARRAPTGALAALRRLGARVRGVARVPLDLGRRASAGLDAGLRRAVGVPVGLARRVVTLPRAVLGGFADGVRRVVATLFALPRRLLARLLSGPRRALAALGSALGATRSRVVLGGRRLVGRVHGVLRTLRSWPGTVVGDVGGAAAGTADSATTGAAPSSSGPRSDAISSPDVVGSIAAAGRRADAAVAAALGEVRATAAGTVGRTRELPAPRLALAVLALALVVGTGVGAGSLATQQFGLSGGDAGRPDAGGQDGGVAEPPDGRVTADVEEAVLRELNAARAERLRLNLSRDPVLARIAADHSRDMASRGYADVVSPAGENVSDRFERFDHDCDRAGQFVLYAESADPSQPRALADELVAYALERERYRSVVLDPDFERAGVGVAVSTDGTAYVSVATCAT